MCQKQCRDENGFKNSLSESYRGLFIPPRPDERGGELGDAETGIRGAEEGGIGEVPPETGGASDDHEK
uniref:KIN17 C2H2-type zinc finger domain-containing protein n=1 Tax=Quercus lobata TaxID=97700 RepID=A0A7N2KQY2_QUELO